MPSNQLYNCPCLKKHTGFVRIKLYKIEQIKTDEFYLTVFPLSEENLTYFKNVYRPEEDFVTNSKLLHCSQREKIIDELLNLSCNTN